MQFYEWSLVGFKWGINGRNLIHFFIIHFTAHLNRRRFIFNTSAAVYLQTDQSSATENLNTIRASMQPTGSLRLSWRSHCCNKQRTLCPGRSCTGAEKSFHTCRRRMRVEETNWFVSNRGRRMWSRQKSPVFWHSWWHSEYTFMFDFWTVRASITTTSCLCIFPIYLFFFFWTNKADEFQDPVRLEHLYVDIPASRNSRIHLQFVHITICTKMIISLIKQM